jgi:trigger factor
MERLEKDTEKKAVEAKLSLAQYITKYLGYQDDKAFNQAIREAAEKNLHLTIAIEKIIDDFKINVNENELNEHLEKMAQVYGTTAADIKQKLINNHNLEGIRTFITQGKMFDKLIEINKVNK